MNFALFSLFGRGRLTPNGRKLDGEHLVVNNPSSHHVQRYPEVNAGCPATRLVCTDIIQHFWKD
jgi:hypothetical protein